MSSKIPVFSVLHPEYISSAGVFPPTFTELELAGKIWF